MPSKPSLELAVVVRNADGAETRWDSNDRLARNRPTGLSFRTKRGDGFADASMVLARRVDQDSVDINLLDEVVVAGGDGSVAYEGYIGATPRSFGEDGHRVTVQTASWMNHAKDRKVSELIVDRDLSKWGPTSVQKRINDLAAGYDNAPGPTVVPDTATGAPSLELTIEGPTAAGHNPAAKGWYDAGPGVFIGSLYYAWKKNTNVNSADVNWYWGPSLSTDDIATTTDASGSLRTAGPGTGTLTATSGNRRYAYVEHDYTAVYTPAAGARATIFWTVLAVYGNHGITKRGTADATNAQGFYASDIIKYIAGKYCPMLNTSGVGDTTFVIPQAVYTDVFPYDVFLDVNKYHQWGLEVWDNKTLTFCPVDLTDYDWEVRLSDLGVGVDLQGDSTDDFANGIRVHYDDMQTGKRNVLEPSSWSQLRDDSVNNPANKHARSLWVDYELSVPSTQASALQFGAAALAERNRPKSVGSISVKGHIRDRAGHWQPVWKVRAGDTVAITDHPNDRPRMIVETDYSHDSREVRIAVDSTFAQLDAVIDRITTDLDAANLKAA